MSTEVSAIKKNVFLAGLKRPKYYALGFFAGILNGFFGAGGGLLAVPMLKAVKLDAKKAHATSISIIAPLCALSGALTLLSGEYKSLDMLLWLIPTGLVGAFVGTLILKKINQRLLGIIFATIMIISAVRLLFL